jgi:hypothetical protein
MKAACLIAIAAIAWQALPAAEPPVAQPQNMKYLRSIALPAATGQACAVLDAAIFPHAAPSLTDLRIFPVSSPSAREIPYAITLSEAVTQDTQPARVLNLGSSNGKISFDLEMPARPYTSATLTLDPSIHDFLATAAVTGLSGLGEKATRTALGSFTLFDLDSQHLSRDTTLPLQESTFPYLHIVFSLSAAPSAAAHPTTFPSSIVEGAEVPPSREAQIVYTPVAETSTLTTTGRESKATFEIPARVPIERVEFLLPPNFKGNFSRAIRITALAKAPAPETTNSGSNEDSNSDSDDNRTPLPETITGNILRVHATEAGRQISMAELAVPAILGANLQQPASIEVTIENGDDQPLPIAAVRLEMRQRKLCFDLPAAPPSALNLYYGDPRLVAPVYDYQQLFTPASNALVATLGPEQLNPAYQPPAAAAQSFTELHPEVLWIALIAVICALGLIAMRSSRKLGH